MGKGLFHNPDFDPDRFAADMEKRAAARTLGILFTPRSGSSWLTDVLTQTRLFGKPQEWFNPNFMGNTLKRVNANSPQGYIDMLRRKHSLGNFFSFEVTIYQMHRVFGKDPGLMAYLPEKFPLIYLRRQDMVLQAVSLAKAVQTDVFHTVNTTPEEIASAEARFEYDGDQIRQWLEHIFDQERKCEAFLADREGPLLRITYEQMMRAGAEQTVRRFLRRWRPLKADDPLTFEPRHAKIGSARNKTFAQRFRDENPGVMAEIAAFREDVRASIAGAG
ncbi:Stf0 sulfotransferase [Roseisalinus antarcticus]|uniref:Stf0 sulfotransferase n=2 Tax=Roseisalinus antarcticus TaxID=254357 RepID=A0A1Y5TPR3_9RHOB|nr:Stf0 sulfotransferase [Roseisalinus antarcticus]